MFIKYFALFVLIVLVAFVLLIVVVLGGLPGKVAAERNHPNKDAIKIGGWATILIAQPGWPFVLMWAYAKPRPIQVEATDTAELRAEIADLRRKLEEAGAES